MPLHAEHTRSYRHNGRLRGFVKAVLIFGLAFALGYQSKTMKMAPRGLSPSSSSFARIDSFPEQRDERNLLRPTKDPHLQPVDCHELLDAYRNGEIPQLRNHSDEIPHHKSYVRLTSTRIPFYVSTSDPRIDRMRVQLFNTGEYYETAMTSAVQAILEELERSEADNRTKRPIVLDVGGNIGWFSLLAAAHGAEALCFEPNVANVVRLCESSVLNGWADGRVRPFLNGVGDEHGARRDMYRADPRNPGSFTFSQSTADAAARTYGRAGALGGAPLQMVTLDALAQDQGWSSSGGAGGEDARIAILKVDVEGLEPEVLRGARGILGSGRVGNVFLEVKRDQGVGEWEEMFSVLLGAGYEPYKFGGHLGPTDAIAARFEDGRDFAADIAKRTFENANIWLRLPK